MVQAVCYIFACTLHGRGFALCFLSFAIMAAAAADLMRPSFACLAPDDEAILMVHRSLCSTAGSQDVPPTPHTARKEFIRFRDSGERERVKLIMTYFYKRPKLGAAVRELLKDTEKMVRASDRSARQYARRRAANEALNEAVAENEALLISHDDMMAVDEALLPVALDPVAPILALTDGDVIEVVPPLAAAICDSETDDATTAGTSSCSSSAGSSPSSSSSARSSCSTARSTARSTAGSTARSTVVDSDVTVSHGVDGCALS